MAVHALEGLADLTDLPILYKSTKVRGKHGHTPAEVRYNWEIRIYGKSRRSLYSVEDVFAGAAQFRASFVQSFEINCALWPHASTSAHCFATQNDF